MSHYVHGYSEREAERLHDQANSVKELLHHDTGFPARSRVLEAGCGVGAQIVTLAKSSPGAAIVSFDISPGSLRKARALINRESYSNVQFLRTDIYALPFQDGEFDHVFVCYVLEHLPDPIEGLASLRRVLKKGGSMTVIEGDHGSCYFHPETEEALRAWNCLIKVQAHLGGNSLIGRQVFPLLKESGFQKIHVSPRMVYVDQSKPDLMDGFVRKTIIPMVEGVREKALEMGLMEKGPWEKGIKDLFKVAESEKGAFCYTFFKATAFK